LGNSSVQNILNILYYTPMVSVKGDEICKSIPTRLMGHISSLKNEEIKIWEAKIMIEKLVDVVYNTPGGYSIMI
jgi:hypothetical protein